jgi:tetratricopeptide (TPR) repeat protein
MSRRAAFLLSAALLGTAGPAFATGAEELFETGNGAYEQGRYEDAAAAYTTILGYGIADPRVLYNLGNASFKMGKLGGAILSYERALRLDPSDREARDNLEFARGRIRDRIPDPELPYPVAVVKSIVDAWSLDALAGLFLIPYIAACGLVGAMAVTRGALRRRLLAYGAAACGVAALVLGVALGSRISGSRAEHAIVMTDRADALSGPAADNTVLFSVHEGTRLDVHHRRADWLQVTLPNGLTGWVRADQVESV